MADPEAHDRTGSRRRHRPQAGRPRRVPLGFDHLEGRFLLAAAPNLDVPEKVSPPPEIEVIAAAPLMAIPATAHSLDAAGAPPMAAVDIVATAPPMAAVDIVAAGPSTALLGAAPGLSIRPTTPEAAATDQAVAQWTISAAQQRGPAATRWIEAVAEGELRPPDSLLIQTLPDAIRTEIVGRIGPDEQMEVYQEPIHPETRSVRIELSVPMTADPTVLERLWLMDGAGRVVGHWRLPEPGANITVTLDAAPFVDPSSLGLYVGIARDAIASGEIAPPAPFVLSIGRDDGPVPLAADPPPTSALTGIASSSSWWMPAMPLGFDSIETSQADSGDSEEEIGLGQGFAVPIPLSSAGPAAGVGVDGFSTRPIRPLDGAVIDLTLIDVSPEGEVPAAAPEPLAIEGLAPIRAPGVMPLLGMSRPAAVRDDAGSVLIATARPEGDSGTSSTRPVGDPCPAKAERSPRNRPALSVSLGLAAALSFGLLLPDLVGRLTPAPLKRPLPRWRRREITIDHSPPDRTD